MIRKDASICSGLGREEDYVEGEEEEEEGKNKRDCSPTWWRGLLLVAAFAWSWSGVLLFLVAGSLGGGHVWLHSAIRRSCLGKGVGLWLEFCQSPAGRWAIEEPGQAE